MSNNIIQSFPKYNEFKSPMNMSVRHCGLDESDLKTPLKDPVLQLKPSVNFFTGIPSLFMSSSKSPNRYSSPGMKKLEDVFDPTLFFMDNHNNKNSNISDSEKNQSYFLFAKDKRLLGKKHKIENKIKKISIFLQINQICLHGFNLSNFPLISIQPVEISRKLIKLLTKKFNYFCVLKNNQKENNVLFPDESELKEIKLNINELKNNNLDYYPKEIDTLTIIKSYYTDIRSTLEKIKKNIIEKKKKIYITKDVILLELLIRNCNLFTDYILNKRNINNFNNAIKNISNYNNPTKLKNVHPTFTLIEEKEMIPKEKEYYKNLPENLNTMMTKKNIDLDKNHTIKNINESNINKLTNSNLNYKQKIIFKSRVSLVNSFKCDFCDRIFKNGQALGGHISQSHPKLSNKYKQKIEIRNSRTERREIIYLARRKLFNKYHIDLDYLFKNKRVSTIKNFIKIHKIEYKKELIQLKKEKGIAPYNKIENHSEIFIQSLDNNPQLIQKNEK